MLAKSLQPVSVFIFRWYGRNIQAASWLIMKNMARVVGLSIVFVRNLLCLIGALETARKVSHVIVLIMHVSD